MIPVTRAFVMLRVAAASALLLLSVAVAGAQPSVHYGAGTKLESLTAGKVTYQRVTVRSVSPRTVMILHAGGMASVRLRDLAPELQAAFGYDPVAEQAEDAALARATAERQARQAQVAQAPQVRERAEGTTFDRLLRDFGRPASVRGGVDMRPQFRALELHAKNQGRRPSCAVFAVVSALEFLRAENTGQAEKLSEEYLIWATGKTLQRAGADAPGLTGEDADAGFALTEVVTALRSYGIPLYDEMPNTIGRTSNLTADPPPEVVTAARQRTQVGVHLVPGRDNATLLNNIVHALNAGLPVAIGTGWPRFFNMRAALLNTQDPIPGYGHAVTLVGYTSETGRIEDATFIFRNSWGANWGANGYGYATYAYLAKHLHNAILLELR